jgi:uncharacterized membrane protein
VKPATWFRIGAVLLLLFAVGHTIGFLSFRAPTAEGRAVWQAMKSTRFSDQHGTFSYGDFYTGFGMFITAAQLFLAWLAWVLASATQERLTRTLGWGMVVLAMAELILALRYFSLVQAVPAALIGVCMAMGAIGSSKRVVAA